MNPSSRRHYFLPGPRLPSQLQSVTDLGRYQFILLCERTVAEFITKCIMHFYLLTTLRCILCARVRRSLPMRCLSSAWAKLNFSRTVTDLSQDSEGAAECQAYLQSDLMVCLVFHVLEFNLFRWLFCDFVVTVVVCVPFQTFSARGKKRMLC